MSTPDIKVSDAELHLLQLLWEEAPLTAAELSDRLPSSRNWSLTTVKTLLSRLVGKGAVRTEADGRRFLYTPAVERETIASKQADRLVDRLFGGRVSPLVAQLAEQREIDAEDLKQLEELVRSLRK